MFFDEFSWPDSYMMVLIQDKKVYILGRGGGNTTHSMILTSLNSFSEKEVNTVFS